jgi:hypothetical protein
MMIRITPDMNMKRGTKCVCPQIDQTTISTQSTMKKKRLLMFVPSGGSGG